MKKANRFQMFLSALMVLKKTVISSTFIIFLFFAMQACKKEGTNSTGGQTSNSNDPNLYTTNVHGKPILKKNLHLIEDGYKVVIQNGHVYKMEKTSGNLVEDFGEFHNSPDNKSASNTTALHSPIQKVNLNHNTGSSSSTGWVAAVEWQNTSSSPINKFSATCTVPPMPSIQIDQPYTFWIGMENLGAQTTNPINDVVLQPILSYGVNVYIPANKTYYGNNNYEVYNVYDYYTASTPQNPTRENVELFTVPVPVSPGTQIQFLITGIGTTGNSYDYVSKIINPTTGAVLGNPLNLTINYTALWTGGANLSSTTTVPSIPLLKYAEVVLEDPNPAKGIAGITSESDYPNTTPAQSYVAIKNISISTGNPGVNNYPSTLSWYQIPNTTNEFLGENAQIVSTNNNNSSSPGQINLWYAPQYISTISIQNYGKVVNAIMIASTTGGQTYNILANPGNSTIQVAPDTYNIIFNSSTGNESYQIFNPSGTIISSNLSKTGQVVTLPNVPFPFVGAEGYTIYISVYGD